MSNLTHTFKLITGPECTIKELNGKHQKILTESSSKAHTDRINEVLADVVVKVGSETNIQPDFFKQVLGCDKKKILIELRKFSLGDEEDFAFGYNYVDKDGKRQTHEVDVILDGDKFTEKPAMVLDKATGVLVPMDYAEYTQVLENINVHVSLPRGGQKVRFTMLNGAGEAIGAATPKNARSSHTPIYMRNPVYFVEKDNKEPYPVKLDLDRLSIKDIEYLRAEIKNYEGEIDTVISFEHPEADLKIGSEKYVNLDILGITAFFFPSEAI